MSSSVYAIFLAIAAAFSSFLYRRHFGDSSFGKDTELALPDSFESPIEIPIIDLSPFYDSAGSHLEKVKQATADAIAAASSTLGSFYVSIPQSQYDVDSRSRLLLNAHKLFQNSLAIKQSHSGASRGFILYGTESGSRHYFEHKEGFSYGYDGWNESHHPSNGMESVNVFPPEQDGDGIERSLSALFDVFVEVSYILLRAYSMVLYQDESVLVDQFKGGETISILRLFHYLSKGGLLQDTSRYLGSSPHTDWGLLTVIMADDERGLQLHHGGEWRTVRPRFNESLLFVNCGDFMSILSDAATNGKSVFHSPLHRVLSPSMEAGGQSERTSFVFFFYPRFDAKIPTATSEREYSLMRDQSTTGNVAQTQFDRNQSFGDYIKHKWEEVTVG